MKQLRRPPQRRTQGGARPRTAREAESGARARSMAGRTLVCGVIFVLLIALKLIVPGNLAVFRGTLGQWLVRDADFAEAFSAVGRAFSGRGEVAEALDNAYIAVFGGEENPAEEVSGASEEIPDDAPPAQENDAPALGMEYAAPLDGAVTSSYGWREHPTTGLEAFHYGVDLAADEGAPIRCFADGTVGVTGESVELGKYLTVLHGDGISTLYAHCSKILVTSGSAVKCGDTLAEVGHTGNATGPHLHFELLNGEGHLDPTAYLSAPNAT